MDILTIFEDKLKTDEAGTEEFAQKWDERAERFYEGQMKGNNYLPTEVTKLLKEKGVLTPERTLLDIGAGSGRYTIPLAKEAKSMLALDFSKEMLRYLNKVSKQENITNITTKQLPWPTEEKVEPVDIAFSAMCPCTRSTEALKQMSKVAQQYGVIAQMTKMGDNIVDELIKEKLIEVNPKDPHNNRDLTQGYFNVLWELGYEPEVHFVVENRPEFVTYEEALEAYKTRFNDVDEKDIERIVTKFTKNNEVELIRTTRLAVILWDVSL